ncbi:BEL1-type homeodomain protein [Hordeum vulgare]|nr:BEL1-type homeodomain protein [Hordeum vulgare]
MSTDEMNDDAHAVACESCSTVHSMLPSASADFFQYAPAEVTITQPSKMAKLIAGEPDCSWLYDGPGAASSRTAAGSTTVQALPPPTSRIT